MATGPFFQFVGMSEVSHTASDSSVLGNEGSQADRKGRLGIDQDSGYSSSDNNVKPNSSPAKQMPLNSSIPRLLLTTSIPQIYQMFNTNITNISLVRIGDWAEADNTITQWLPLLFQISSAVFGILVGMMNARIGPAWVIRISWIMNIVADLVIALSPSIYLIMVCRVVSGIGVSFGIGCHALLQRMMASQETLKRLFSFQSMVIGLINICVVMCASFVLDVPDGNGWRYAYTILAGVDLLSIIACFTLIPKLPKFGDSKRFDVGGFILFGIMICSFVMFITSFSQDDWPYWVSIIIACIFAISIPLFGFNELKCTKNPVIDLRVIANRNSIMFFIVIIVLLGCVFGTNYMIPYLCSVTFQLSSILTSCMICVLFLCFSLINLILANVLKKFVSKLLFFIGILSGTTGIFIVGCGAYFSILWLCYFGMAIIGAGFGTSLTSIMGFLQKIGGKNIAMYSALFLTFQTIGQAVFVSLATIIWNSFQDYFLSEDMYDQEGDADGSMYRLLYGRAIASTIMIFGGVLIIIGCCTLIMRPFSVERGQIGFKEKELDHNFAKDTIIQNAELQNIELIPVQANANEESFIVDEDYFDDEF